ncbi:sugar/nucleoside kinase (ribokinase family) [Ciceribacter lividus]|uniref:Sugar/nucleoside kinase (Ribokinase family) n=1 Tax=Ciceribacter lividus TaxID=1197950 RepID=A0A6I7HJ20_9HYPH|nr:PfkB family carbohydrate kinase [Ciceribacter lividus]RCW21058.1 sugar/nucleoside kinase (ribokinase family) [Ciceribacter lividus]
MDIVVVGNVNHDHIWRITEPLRPGGRISFSDRSLRLGGGGYYTGRRLIEFGHRVTLVASLARDAHGLDALRELAALGFVTDHVTLTEGRTEFAEILLDPAGERTILGSVHKAARTVELSEPLPGDAFYVNGTQLPDTLITALRQAPLVVSQFPLRSVTPRPADVMVGSIADFPGERLDAIWERARGIAGERLNNLLLTDGPNSITIHDGRQTTEVRLTDAVTTADTIGAGDSFSGALLHYLLLGHTIGQAASEAGRATADWLRRRDAERVKMPEMPAFES